MAKQLKKHANEDQKSQIDHQRKKKKQEEGFDFNTGFDHGFGKYDTAY